jgi:hypothetical protein
MGSHSHCHNGMAHSQVEGEGDFLQIWRVAVNILNKKWRGSDGSLL